MIFTRLIKGDRGELDHRKFKAEKDRSMEPVLFLSDHLKSLRTAYHENEDRTAKDLQYLTIRQTVLNHQYVILRVLSFAIKYDLIDPKYLNAFFANKDNKEVLGVIYEYFAIGLSEEFNQLMGYTNLHETICSRKTMAPFVPLLSRKRF